jgi:hypothetical protein
LAGSLGPKDKEIALKPDLEPDLGSTDIDAPPVYFELTLRVGANPKARVRVRVRLGLAKWTLCEKPGRVGKQSWCVKTAHPDCLQTC